MYHNMCIYIPYNYIYYIIYYIYLYHTYHIISYHITSRHSIHIYTPYLSSYTPHETPRDSAVNGTPPWCQSLRLTINAVRLGKKAGFPRENDVYN